MFKNDKMGGCNTKMENDKIVTVLTPCYNRAELLGKLYKSLLNQEIKNFVWLIIDDGSYDNTEEVVTSFQCESIPINYYKKENGGKHTAINYAMRYIKTPLTIIVDSDDQLLSCATKKIETYYLKYRNQEEQLCSLSFLRCYRDGNPILSMDKDEFISDYPTCRVKENRPGDMAEVYFTDRLKKYKFPEVSNEKFLSEDVVWIRMGIDYKTVYINQIIYQGEYLEGGLTDNDKKLKFNSPIGSMYRGIALMHRECGFKANIKGAIIFSCYRIVAKKLYKNLVNENLPKGNILTAVMSPLGAVFYLVWRS